MQEAAARQFALGFRRSWGLGDILMCINVCVRVCVCVFDIGGHISGQGSGSARVR